MKALIIDIGSKANRIGGESRVAAQLHEKLQPKVETFYLGFETKYIKCKNNCFILDRNRIKLSKQTTTKLSENWIFRAGYYFLAGRLFNIGISRKEIKQVFGEFKPDFVISNSVSDFPVIKYASKFFRFKSIYIDHVNLSGNVFKGLLSKNSLPLTLGSGIFGLSVDQIKKKLLDFFDAKVALNLEQKKNLEKITKNVYYIPNGIEPKKKRADAGKSFREKYNLQGKFVYLYVGRLFERQKNISTLIKAFKNINDSNAALVLVGEGPSKNDYINMARGDNRIIFTGAIDDKELDDVYWGSNLLVMPSMWEGFSITMLEASAHSLPMLVSHSAKPKDFEEEGIEIETFEPKDWEGLSKKMQEIKEPRRYRSAKKESEKIAKIFSEERMINSYIELLYNLSKEYA